MGIVRGLSGDSRACARRASRISRTSARVDDCHLPSSSRSSSGVAGAATAPQTSLRLRGDPAQENVGVLPTPASHAEGPKLSGVTPSAQVEHRAQSGVLVVASVIAHGGAG